MGFALKSPKSHLETVSTVRGSGWVAVPKCEIAIDYEYDRFTHPLPRTVLTVSKRDVLTFEARPSASTNTHDFSEDQHTRITLFAVNVEAVGFGDSLTLMTRNSASLAS
jgi:hypothetical protein